MRTQNKNHKLSQSTFLVQSDNCLNVVINFFLKNSNTKTMTTKAGQRLLQPSELFNFKRNTWVDNSPHSLQNHIKFTKKHLITVTCWKERNLSCFLALAYVALSQFLHEYNHLEPPRKCAARRLEMVISVQKLTQGNICQS